MHADRLNSMKVFEVVELAESEGVQEPHMAQSRRNSVAITINPLRGYSPMGAHRNPRNSSRPPDNNQTASPLAQLYKPLGVDGDTMGSDEDHGALTPTVVSYGPATRKRPTSAKRTIRDPTTNSRRYSSTEGTKLSPNLLLSTSPEQPEIFGNGQGESKTEGTDISKAIEEIEKRQRRMEDLLNVIAYKLEGNTRHME